MTKKKAASLMSIGSIAQSILILRGQRVLLDSELMNPKQPKKRPIGFVELEERK